MVQILVLIATLVGSATLMTWPSPAAQAAAGESGPASREALEATESTAAVELDGVVLFPVRGTTSFPAEQRALAIHKRLVAVARDATVRLDAVRTVEADASTDIMAGDRILMSVFDADARLEGLDRQVVAAAHSARIRAAIEQYRQDRSPETLMKGAVAAGIATVALVLSVWLVWRALRRAERALEARYHARVHGLTI
jgi:hypothetical protein